MCLQEVKRKILHPCRGEWRILWNITLILLLWRYWAGTWWGLSLAVTMWKGQEDILALSSYMCHGDDETTLSTNLLNWLRNVWQKGTAIKEHHYYNIRQRLIIYSPIHPLVFLNLASYVPLPSSIFKAFYSHAWQNIKALSIIYSNGKTHEHKRLLCSVSENQLKRS